MMGARREPWYLVGGGFVAAWVGMDLLTGLLHPAGVSPWYPGAGLTVTLFYRFGVRYAPALVIAEAVRWSIGHVPALSLGAVCGEGVVLSIVYGGAVLLLRDRLGVLLPSVRPRDAAWFCLAALVATGVAALASVEFLVRAGALSRGAFVDEVRIFWLGDAVGVLAVTPLADLLLSAARRQLPAVYRRRVTVREELASLAAVVALGVLTFGVLPLDPARTAYFVLTLVPLALLAAREGMRGAILGGAALDFTLVICDAARHVTGADVATGQSNVIIQTIFAFLLGALASSRRQYRNYSRWLVMHDMRTDLPNRVVLDDWARGSYATALWVACIDLDHFGLIDAAMERPAANSFLRAATERIANVVPESEFFGRFESEAFVLARSGERDEGEAYARRVLEEFRAPLRTQDAEFGFTVSIGLAFGRGRDRRALLTEAIASMREAKSQGGNRLVVFEPPAGIASGPRLAADLVRARDRHEFLLLFQPIHRLDENDRIVGFEALLRWQHPELGLLRPAAFLAALEQSSLLDEIEPWVVHEACSVLARLGGVTRDLRVWINLSGRAAFDDAFVGAMPSIARAAGVPFDRVVIEITEQVVAATEKIAAVTKRIAALGAGVAVDDFGTGHSSLSRVRISHVDYLKLDRSFVSAVEEDPRARTVALTMIEFGGRIGAAVVAEGLETAAQIAIFRDGGCTLGQGYALSEPMDERALRTFLRR